MARKRDESGVPYTCPFIDEVIDALKFCQCEYVRQGDAISALEKVRGYNDDLRTWGNEQYTHAADLQESFDKLERELDNANDVIKDLTS